MLRSAPATRVYPGALGWANQLGQVLAQEVCHACSVFLWCSVSVMHDGIERFMDRPMTVLDTVAHPIALVKTRHWGRWGKRNQTQVLVLFVRVLVQGLVYFVSWSKTLYHERGHSLKKYG